MSEATVANASNSKEPKKFDVIIRTLAGHQLMEEVRATEKVGKLTNEASKEFEKKGQLGPGDYALTLPRLNADAELDPTSTLHDAGVVPNDVLVLVSRTPQVDGR
jgi:hypothetical protein